MKPSRALAAMATCDVLLNGSGRSIEHALEAFAEREDISFLRALVIGSVRHWRKNEWILSQFLVKSLPKKEMIIHALLLNSVHELLESLNPSYAIVNESVKALASLNKPWAKKLVNGVLRNLERNRERLMTELNNQSLSIKSSHPDWLVAEFTASWPDQVESFLEINNTFAPLTLRFKSPEQRNDYESILDINAIEYSLTKASELGIIIHTKIDVTALPGFSNGDFYVQDEAPQLLARLIHLPAQARVLDACAAPGGKTSLVLQQWPDVEMTAIDVSQARCRRLEQNLERLKLKANVCNADIRALENWWDGHLFDCILLDVPCSSTGVIRRHPEIKWTRSTEDLEKLTHLQRELMLCTWELLSAGGVMLFSTCSVLQQENDAQIAWFLANIADAAVVEIDLSIGVKTQFGWQLFPTIGQNDGFYYSKLIKSQTLNSKEAS